jgi:hypothetical protein
MAALHLATNTFLAVVHRYELHRSIARDHGFVARVNNTRTAYAMTTISGALMSTLVVSLPALFDDGQGAVSLKRVINILVQPESVAPLKEHHGYRIIRYMPLPVRLDVDNALARLGRMRSRLNRDPLRAAITRLKDLRNQEAAHIDVEPVFASGKARPGDVDLVYAAAANIIVSCNLIAARRFIPAAQIRLVARVQADLFRQSIVPV